MLRFTTPKRAVAGWLRDTYHDLGLEAPDDDFDLIADARDRIEESKLEPLPLAVHSLVS